MFEIAVNLQKGFAGFQLHDDWPSSIESPWAVGWKTLQSVWGVLGEHAGTTERASVRSVVGVPEGGKSALG